jgi:hypothetical protein
MQFREDFEATLIASCSTSTPDPSGFRRPAVIAASPATAQLMRACAFYAENEEVRRRFVQERANVAEH